LKPLIEEGIVEKQKRSRTTMYRLKVFDPEWIRAHKWAAAAVITMGANDSPATIGERIQGALMMNPHRRFCIYREGDKIWLVMMAHALNFDMAND